MISPSTISCTGRLTESVPADPVRGTLPSIPESMSEVSLSQKEQLVADDDRSAKFSLGVYPATSTASRHQRASLLDLPFDMVDAVVCRVDMRSLSALACVCHSMKKLTVRS